MTIRLYSNQRRDTQTQKTDPVSMSRFAVIVPAIGYLSDNHFPGTLSSTPLT
jgi:hypothetical protein